MAGHIFDGQSHMGSGRNTHSLYQVNLQVLQSAGFHEDDKNVGECLRSSVKVLASAGVEVSSTPLPGGLTLLYFPCSSDQRTLC